MARRRLTPAQPGYLGPGTPPESGPGPGQDPSAVTPPASIPPIPPIAQVSGRSAEAAALREVTAGIDAARANGRMVVDVPLGDVSQGYLARDRVALDPDGIAALKASIASYGQRAPAEITPLHGAGRDETDGAPAHAWGLISGWRRLRALSELYEETGEPRFSTLRALVRPPEEAAQSYVAMVEENEIRLGLSYYERARVVAESTARGVFGDQAAALRTLFATASRAKRSKIGSFIEIHEALGDLLHFSAEIPERLGLALVARLRLGERSRMRGTLRGARPATAAAELALLEKLSKPPRSAGAGVSRAKQTREHLRGGVEMELKRVGGRITVTLTGAGVDERLLVELREALGPGQDPKEL